MRPDEKAGVVLVFEHDPAVADLQRLYLGRDGFQVKIEPDRSRALAVIAEVRPDVIVLDLAELEPPLTVAELYRRVNEAARPVPIVCVLPSGRDAPGERAITRPFSPRQLVGAVAEALRGRADEVAADVLRAGSVML